MVQELSGSPPRRARDKQLRGWFLVLPQATQNECPRLCKTALRARPRKGHFMVEGLSRSLSCVQTVIGKVKTKPPLVPPQAQQRTLGN